MMGRIASLRSRDSRSMIKRNLSQLRRLIRQQRRWFQTINGPTPGRTLAKRIKDPKAGVKPCQTVTFS